MKMFGLTKYRQYGVNGGSLLVILAIGLSGCGAGSKEATTQLTSELSEQLSRPDELPFVLEADDYDCVAEEVVELIGANQIEVTRGDDGDIDTSQLVDLSPSDSVGLSLAHCVDLVDLFVEDFAADDASASDCMRNKIQESDLIPIFGSDEEAAFAAVIDVAIECID